MSKEEKYDRQLRLWQSQGQSSLESSHVLVISPTITSVELLKNLVLPNIGQFTLLDLKKDINEVDLGNNFFLNDNDLGHDKLETLTKNINELNWDVRGHYLNVPSDGFTSIDEFISHQDDDFWKQFTLIVYNWNNDTLINVSDDLNIPLLITNSFGFYGFLRVYKPTFATIETHPETLVDLRILYPWKELLHYSNSIDLESLDIEAHSQIPYLIIQLKAVQYWLQSHNNLLPATSNERQEFKKLITNWKKDYNELNFDEAVSNSHKIFNKTKIPSNVQEIFEKIEEFEESEDEFWILVRALHKFVELNDGLLPISGELPDMDSNTENYSILKKLYKEKFVEDFSQFTDILKTVTDLSISEETVKIFLKNAKHLFFSKNSRNRLDFNSFQSTILHDYNLTDFDGRYDFKPVLLSYVLIETYYSNKKEFPTTLDDLEGFIADIPEQIASVIPRDKLLPILYELIRGQNYELNNISSFLGGIGGQEAIKLITSQYVPLDNFLAFDGINSVTAKVKL